MNRCLRLRDVEAGGVHIDDAESDENARASGRPRTPLARKANLACGAWRLSGSWLFKPFDLSSIAALRMNLAVCFLCACASWSYSTHLTHVLIYTVHPIQPIHRLRTLKSNHSPNRSSRPCRGRRRRSLSRSESSGRRDRACRPTPAARQGAHAQARAQQPRRATS